MSNSRFQLAQHQIFESVRYHGGEQTMIQPKPRYQGLLAISPLKAMKQVNGATDQCS
jgi:hypothetical protein